MLPPHSPGSSGLSPGTFLLLHLSLLPAPALSRLIQVHGFKIHLEAVSPPVQSILRAHGYRTYKFAYLLKFVAPKSILAMPLWSLVDMSREAQAEFPRHTFPAGVEQGDTLPSYFNSHAINKYDFHGLVSCFSHFCAFCKFMV